MRMKEIIAGKFCIHCGEENVVEAERVISAGTIKQQYRCKSCGRRFIDRSDIEYNRKIRLNKNTDQVEYICPHCENILQYNNEDKTYYCEPCNVSFDKLNRLEKVDYKYIARKAREVQRKRDELRIQNKFLREDFRKLNAMEEFGKKLYDVFKEHSINFKTIKHQEAKRKIGGIFQLSDLHFNELILSIDKVGNEYDFDIASKRCYSFVQEAIRVFDAFNIKTVWVSMTGDILNSDRRADELINKATSRANAYFIAVCLIEQIILDLNKKYDIWVSGVSGNEARFNIEYNNATLSLQDNFDYMIYQQLKIDFKDKEGINFIDLALGGDVVNFFGKRIFVKHGLEMKQNNTQKDIQSENGRMSFKGTPFDFAITGHYHSTNIGDLVARSSSMAGGNLYSDKELALYSKAAQNIHIVSSDFIHSMKIDLQDNYCDVGYEYDKQLEAYDRKSLDKLRKPKKIIEIF